MKRIACLVAGLLLLCGCEYDVPLTQDAVLPVDPALIGLWQEIPEEGKAEDPEERLVILQFSKTEYLVVMSPGEEGGLYFRAYPVRVEDLDLIQLEWLGADKEDEDPYHVCRYLQKRVC